MLQLYPSQSRATCITLWQPPAANGHCCSPWRTLVCSPTWHNYGQLQENKQIIHVETLHHNRKENPHHSQPLHYLTWIINTCIISNSYYSIHLLFLPHSFSGWMDDVLSVFVHLVSSNILSFFPFAFFSSMFGSLSFPFLFFENAQKQNQGPWGQM